MQLSKARIANFRSLKNVEVDLGDHNVFIGGNGAGKSSIIRALDRFFATSRVLDVDDFFGRDQSAPVEIELTFSSLSDAEHEAFGNRVRDDKLIVTRVFNTGPESGSYYGSTLVNPDFDHVRQVTGAILKRNSYSELRQTGKYVALEPATSAAAVDAGMAKWENDNPEQLVLGRDDGRFFGFQNASRTAIGRYISFVFIPAVRDALVDAVDSKNSPVGRLMELLVRSQVLKRKEVSEFRERMNAEYQRLIAPDNMPELERLAQVLSAEIQLLYQEASVGLAWQPAREMEVPLPSADVTLSDVGFGGPVDRQGHGLQRAFIFTLLQQLAKASVPPPELTEAETDAGENPKQADAPNVIIAIEEPELYQHPTKQRHFSTVLRNLSSQALPGAGGKTQIILASHSPLFVSLPDVEEIRFVRRADCEGYEFKHCELSALSLDSVASKLGACYRKPEGVFTAAGLIPRLHILGAELAEGFFADAVVLVEGVSDKAALYAAAGLLGKNFEAQGISVLPVGGKNNLDRPYLIFRQLGIPTFIIWDCDEANCDQNLALMRAIEPEADHQIDAFSTIVGCGYARFSKKLEVTLRQELGNERFVAARALACEHYGVTPGQDVEKSPAVMSLLLVEAAKTGATSATLKDIVSAIWRDLKGKNRN